MRSDAEQHWKARTGWAGTGWIGFEDVSSDGVIGYITKHPRSMPKLGHAGFTEKPITAQRLQSMEEHNMGGSTLLRFGAETYISKQNIDFKASIVAVYYSETVPAPVSFKLDCGSWVVISYVLLRDDTGK